MAQIYEPVITWDIILTYVKGGKEIVEKFKSVSHLSTYFNDFRMLGDMVGYVIDKNRKPGPTDHLYTKASLSFYYADQHVLGSNEFRDVFEMVRFFEAHPPLAKLVGYRRKPKT